MSEVQSALLEKTTYTPDEIINALAPLVHPDNHERNIPGCATKKKRNIIVNHVRFFNIQVVDAHRKFFDHRRMPLEPNQTEVTYCNPALTYDQYKREMVNVRSTIKAAILQALQQRDGNAAPKELTDDELCKLPSAFAHRVALPRDLPPIQTVVSELRIADWEWGSRNGMDRLESLQKSIGDYLVDAGLFERDKISERVLIQDRSKLDNSFKHDHQPNLDEKVDTDGVVICGYKKEDPQPYTPKPHHEHFVHAKDIRPGIYIDVLTRNPKIAEKLRENGRLGELLAQQQQPKKSLAL